MGFSTNIGKITSFFRHLHMSYYMVAVIFGVILLTNDPAQYIEALITPIERTLNDVVIISAGLLLLIAIAIAASPAGRIRLGQHDEKPGFSTFSWLAMLFAAGMGTGLVFSGFAEPLLHYTNPPTPGSSDFSSKHAKAMLITYYHWGLHAWAIYGLAALTVAYFSYCHNEPMLASGPLKYLTNKPLPLKLRNLVNSIAIIAALFGIAASIAQGVWLIDRGLVRLTGVEKGTGLLWILAAIIFAFILSAMSGIGRGIKWLSIANIWLAVGLFFIVLMISPSGSITSGIHYIFSYIIHLPSLSIDSQTLSSDDRWLTTWPSAYMIWWVAWTPFVGIFIARISRGYTIRTFMLGVLMAPVAFSFVWFSVFGDVAFYVAETHDAMRQFSIQSMPTISFAVLETLPHTTLTMSLVMLLVSVFLITSADSGSYILGMFAHDGALRPPRYSRMSWGLCIAAITLWLTYQPDGMRFIRQIIVLTALPFLLIIWLQVIALLKTTRFFTRH